MTGTWSSRLSGCHGAKCRHFGKHRRGKSNLAEEEQGELAAELMWELSPEGRCGLRGGTHVAGRG